MNMRLLERLFPSKEVRGALTSVIELERALPDSLGPQLGFAAIKFDLRRQIIHKPEDLRLALKTTQYSIPVLVLILARNIAWDELETGQHMTFGTRTTMTGSGLIALHHHLTDLIEEAGAETTEEAQRSKASLKGMIRMRFG
jgi:hypothetical protein